MFQLLSLPQRQYKLTYIKTVNKSYLVMMSSPTSRIEMSELKSKRIKEKEKEKKKRN